MNFFKSIIRKAISYSFDRPWEWMWMFGPTAKTGVVVSPDNAMLLASVYAAVKAISEDLAKVPLVTYRRLEKGKERAFNHPLYSLLHDTPNERQTAFEFREMQQAHLLLRGNGYVFTPRSNLDGAILELIPLHPDSVRAEVLPGGKMKYTLSREDGRQVELKPEEMWHLRGLSFDGFMGVTPLQYFRDVIGYGMVMQDHSSYLFKNHARPGVVLEHPGKLGEKAAKDLRQQWQEMYADEGAGRTAVLEEGMKANVLTMSQSDLQYLDSRKFNRTEIAAIFRIPPHKIGDLERATFSNIEQQNIYYVIDTLMPWAKRWEASILKNLITAKRTYFSEFLFDSLLRGDTKTRYDAYAVARNWGWFSVNDILELENRNGIGPQGDVYLQPVNMADSKNPPEPVDTPDPPVSEDDKHAEYLDMLRRVAEAISRRDEDMLKEINVHVGGVTVSSGNGDADVQNDPSPVETEVTHGPNGKVKKFVKRSATKPTVTETTFEYGENGKVSKMIQRDLEANHG